MKAVIGVNAAQTPVAARAVLDNCTVAGSEGGLMMPGADGAQRYRLEFGPGAVITASADPGHPGAVHIGPGCSISAREGGGFILEGPIGDVDYMVCTDTPLQER